MKMAILGVGALLFAVVALACNASLDDVDSVAANSVAVRDNRFDARVIEVPVGTTVTWTWEGSRPHDVAGDGWKSEVQSSGRFEHTFSEAGVYDYRCTLHGGMTGRVVVTE